MPVRQLVILYGVGTPVRAEGVAAVTARVKQQRGPERDDLRHVLRHVHFGEITREQLVCSDDRVEFRQQIVEIVVAHVATNHLLI